MTNKNITIDIPFLLEPVGKDYLWGGNKLKAEFNKNNIKCTPLAETWECSTHPEGLSKIRSGIFKGEKFATVLENNPEILCNSEHKNVFPVLLKLIDAKEKLSVQVHPSDEYAERNEKGQRGKTEFWYILDAEPGASIYLGFKNYCPKENIYKLIQSGELEAVLNKIPVKKGDSFLVKPGTVHAIGKGIILAEIQENSNITYRLYDYGRRDSKGKKRELHIAQALKILDVSTASVTQRRMKNVKYSVGVRKEELFSCKYFKSEAWSVTGICYLPKANLNNIILLCVEGGGELFVSDSTEKIFNFTKGDCFFIPYSHKLFFTKGIYKIVVVRI